MKAETNGNGRILAKPGFYKHKETGVVVELDITPGIGTPIIDAYIQAGFQYIGDMPEEVVSETKEAIVAEATEEVAKAEIKKK